MVTIIKTEFMKLKRYFIVWIGVSLMLLPIESADPFNVRYKSIFSKG